MNSAVYSSETCQGDIEMSTCDNEKSDGNEVFNSEVETVAVEIASDIWKFNLKEDLDGGTLILNDGETVQTAWSFASDSISFSEIVLSVLTAGIYYLVYYVLSKTKKTRSVIVTSDRVIVKEEKFMAKIFCSSFQRMSESQISYKIPSLTYVLAEECGVQLFGLIRPSVAIELHFSLYPALYELPESAYQSSLKILVLIVAKAIKFAYKVDYKAPPEKRINQIMQAKWSSIKCACKFAAGLALHSFLIAIKTIRKFIKFGNDHVSIRVLRIMVDESQDEKCKENMRRVVQTITNLLPRPDIIYDDDKIKYPHKVDSSKVPCKVNSTNQYGAAGGFTILQDQLYLHPDEQIYDVCPNNPRLTWSEIYNVGFTAGVYYFMVVIPKLAYTCSYLMTDRRVIKHSVLLDISGLEVQHSRLDFWILDPVIGDFMLLKVGKPLFYFHNSDYGSELYATTTSKGGLNLDLYCFQFAVNMLKIISRQRKVRESGLTFHSIEDKGKYSKFKTTSDMLYEDEIIDVSVHSTPQRNLFQYFAAIWRPCSDYTTQTALTFTNRGIYLETHDVNTLGMMRGRNLMFITWDKVDGVYWSNYQPHVNSCGIANILNFGCKLLTCNCSGCTRCVDFCVPNASDSSYTEAHHGQSGSRLRVNLKGNNSFSFGIDTPALYYGVQDRNINAMVDTLVYSTNTGDTTFTGCTNHTNGAHIKHEARLGSNKENKLEKEVKAIAKEVGKNLATKAMDAISRI